MVDFVKTTLTSIGMDDVVKNIEKHQCPFCSNPIHLNEFKDSISLREYNISGMCQICQDGFFNTEDDEQDYQD